MCFTLIIHNSVILTCLITTEYTIRFLVYINVKYTSGILTALPSYFILTSSIGSGIVSVDFNGIKTHAKVTTVEVGVRVFIVKVYLDPKLWVVSYISKNIRKLYINRK